MTDQVLTISEMCTAFDVTPRTLRFYESKELLSPRRQGQRRLFTRRDKARLTLILRGKRFGMSLEDIRQLLDLYSSNDGGLRQLDCSTDAARRRLAEMERERAALDASIAELRAHLGWANAELAARRTAPAA